MWTVFAETLKESINRRVALALIVVSVFFLVIQVGFTSFERGPGGELMVRRFHAATAANARTFVVTEARTEQVTLLAGLWVMLSLFAATPLLTSYMEKGWVELLLSKGTPRWQVLAGRYGGAIALFAGTAVIMNVLSVVYFSFRAGVPLRPYLLAVSVVALSFISSLSLMALISTAQANAALLVLIVFLETIVSRVLRERKQMYGMITAKWVQWSLDWLYRILPKHEDLNGIARSIAMGRPVDDWFPLWTTALFTLAASAWAFYRFSRKDF